jgi:integrase
MEGGFANHVSGRLGVPVGDAQDSAQQGQPLAADHRAKVGSGGLDWVDFHVTGRTHATLMNELHDDPKMVADQLGDTLDVSQNVYTQASVDRRKKAVDAVEATLAMPETAL